MRTRKAFPFGGGLFWHSIASTDWGLPTPVYPVYCSIQSLILSSRMIFGADLPASTSTFRQSL
ncbi:MAG: hypothetical protein K5867_09125 [Bacteroidales bacterium]|nr:hypothetical protein [Bacteroidales bacterium]